MSLCENTRRETRMLAAYLNAHYRHRVVLPRLVVGVLAEERREYSDNVLARGRLFDVEDRYDLLRIAAVLHLRGARLQRGDDQHRIARRQRQRTCCVKSQRVPPL